MKRIIYILVALSAVWFAGCQEDQLEGEMPGKEVPLTFNGRASNLSLDALTAEVDALHLLIFNEDGTLSQHKQYAGLKDVKPVKLVLGKYTFAYLSNIDEAQISGIEEGKTLEDVTLSLEKDTDGENVLPGSIFAGKSEVVVGEDKTSNAELSRLVGKLDINVEGVKSGVEVKSVTLLGSPEKIRFDGSAVGDPVRLKVPMKEQGQQLKGEAIAFPTCQDTLARLAFQIEVNGEIQNYVVGLKNRVEANKIHTINAKINVSGGLVNVTIEMDVEPWGETVSEDLSVDQRKFVDTLTVKLLMETGSPEDLRQVRTLNMHFLKNDGDANEFSINVDSWNAESLMVWSEDTLIVTHFNQVLQGNYSLVAISLRDSSGMNMYVLQSEVENVIIDSTGSVVIVLPKMKDIAAGDLQAMLEIREALRAANVSMVDNWESDNLNLWHNVHLDENGRVIGIGYQEWEDFLEDYDQVDMTKKASMKANILTRSSEEYPVWSLPESFKNLTALKWFNMGESYGSLAEIPSYMKEMTALEELSVNTDATSLPELPANLIYLNVSSLTLTAIPTHIGNLTKLEGLVFSVPYENDDEEIGDYFPMLSKSRITSADLDFSGLTNLKYLYLVATPSCELPASVWNVTRNVIEFAIAGFRNVQIPSSADFSSIREFSVANENMLPADIERIKSFQVTRLRLYSPVFGKNGLPDWMGQMNSLKSITLDSCGITSIPESFNNLNNLEDLYLPRNPELTGILPAGLLEVYNSGNLYVSASDSPNFSPDGIMLSVDNNLIMAPAEGGIYFVEVRSNAEWTCEVLWAEYVHVALLDGNENVTDSIVGGNGVLTGRGNARLRVTVDPNNPNNYWPERNGDITIHSGRHVAYINVVQKEMLDPVLDVSQSVFTVRSGDTIVFDVTSNMGWNVDVMTISGDGWMDMNMCYGEGNQRLECTVHANQSSVYKIIITDYNQFKSAEVTVNVESDSGEIPRDSTRIN